MEKETQLLVLFSLLDEMDEDQINQIETRIKIIRLLKEKEKNED